MSIQGIQLLDTSSIHQLRSSLVISTLPQCLKELINNAIDANSTSIDILIDIEKFSLQVNDNGYGIQNMSKIGQRHVTSKCHTLSDISQLKTFGFRGEALAAITNESMVQIISRHYLSKDTFEGFWRDGKIIGNNISHSKHTRKNLPGTSIIVRDLFYKFPVRRRHSAANAHQHVVMLESVKRLIMNFALCFHNINFTLIDNARNTKVLMVKRSNSSLDVFRQLFGQDMTKYTKSLKMHEDNIKVDGFFSNRGYPNKAQQCIYINNFIVPNNNELYKMVSDLFASSNFMMEQQEQDSTQKGKEMLTEFSPFRRISSLLKKFTFQFLRLSGLLTNNTMGEKPDNKKRTRAPSSSVTAASESTSRTTSKYLEHSPYVSTLVHKNSSSSVKSSRTNTIVEDDEQANFVTWWDPNLKQTFYIDPRTGNSYLLPPTTSRQNSHIPKNSIDRSRLKKTKLYHKREGDESAKNSYGRAISESIQQDPLFSNTPSRYGNVLDMPHKLSKVDLQNASVLGQVDKKYIVIKLNGNSASLVMIDQHAADERVLLEDMLKQPSSFIPTTLEPSICLELDSTYEYQILTSERILKYLKIWGIHIITTATNNKNNSPINTKNSHNYQQYDGASATDTTTLLSQSRFFSTTKTSPHFFNNDERLLLAPNSKKRNYLNRVYVTQLPQLIIERCAINHGLLKDLIQNYAYWLKEQKDDTSLYRSCPKGIMEILKSKACRGAVMFNDILTLEKCQEIVEELSNCNFPFQCAHGRPSIVPINIDMNSMYNRHDRKTNWNTFKK